MLLFLEQQRHLGLPDDEVEMVFNRLIAPKPKKSIKRNESHHLRLDSNRGLIFENQASHLAIEEEENVLNQPRLQMPEEHFEHILDHVDLEIAKEK